MMYVDLGELPELLDGYRFWSYERPNFAAFYRRHYFGDASVPLDTAVREAVHTRLGIVLDGPIRLLTHFRYFGYCFNSVSFYYCFDADGTTIRAVVAEITNTPWGERHTYFLNARNNENLVAGRFQWTFPKTFHVSPFMPMNVMYDWRFMTPADRLNVHMVNRIEGQKHLDVTLTLSRLELSQRTLNRVLLGYPAMTAKAYAAIHWQALRLWLKRVPFYEHPGRKKEG